ncbi:putative heme/steroid binding protein [Actinoplanes octamycinicus]|uniref:Putative heme/steroid binding protein n=1 Tax=Actinoplanes octamycinicus TaxID=135948 RepID=A0A7W7H0Y8_9ACTN|nr:RICIN domain-containing protein [Actinoplanes octamycinicus]MBB4741955.1 putative heme/steroid binding protein [Actinoplanes octamycinicus]GIE60720.1 hypothetical protein Aoc01nite_61220 [Actinoplanes octamycinicus]
MSGKFCARVLALLLALGVPLLPMESASATPPFQRVHVGFNNKCLDADVNTIWTNGTKVQLWDCNGSPQQLWWREGNTIHVGYNGKCLDADFNNIWNNGTKVQLWDCNGSQQQQWISVNGALHVGFNNKCLDADFNAIWSNGTKVQLWDCNGSQQQQWNFRPVNL